MNSHYISLLIAYTVAALCWFLLHKSIYKNLWSSEVIYNPKKPYLEFIFAILAVIVILFIGQLYTNGLLLPNSLHKNNFIDALNQLIIFSPTLILIFIRKDALDTIWLPKSNVMQRIGVGFSISLIAIFTYWLVRKDAASIGSILYNTFNVKNISHLVQVFMEDITIALIFVRLSNWIGYKWSLALVATLFATAHIPSMISNGYTLNEMSSLFLDTAIGIIILFAVSKSKDVWWFFIVHFVMDMTQYYGSY